MLHRLKALCATIALALSIPALAAAATENPQQVVGSYYDVLLKVMHGGKTLGYWGRYDELKPAVERTFNIPFMAQSAVGSYWDTMTPDQRTKLVDAFRAFTIANYANHFGDWGGERFETYREQETPRKDVIVYSAIVKSDGDKVNMNYLLRQAGGEYRVIDVFLDGSISELATRRSEYTSVIRRDGVDALIALIRQKANGLGPAK